MGRDLSAPVTIVRQDARIDGGEMALVFARVK
jgi:hypothetical protein